MKRKAILAALVALAMNANANEGPVEVKGCFMTVPTTVDRVGETVIGQSEIYGIAESLPAGGPWDNTKHSCRAVWTTMDGGYEYANRCTNVDPDGDRFITMATGVSPQSFKWTYLGGTGKYQGITGGGTGRFEEMYPEDNVACWRREGSYRIKN